MYVRVGFRSVSCAPPDEDGYIELVSLLPGVTDDLLRVLGEDRRRKGLPELDWRTLSSRRQSITSGVRHESDGRTTIEYGFEVDKKQLVVVATVEDCSMRSVVVDGVPDPRFAGSTAASPPTADAVLATAAMGDGLRAEIDTAGELAVYHPRHLGPVYTDPFPTDAQVPAAVRRPVRRRVSSRIDGSVLVSCADGTRREVRVRRDSVDIRVSSPDGRLVASPRPGLRNAECAVSTTDGYFRSGHLVRGLWPVDLTDFEAAADAVASWELAGTRLRWTDPARGAAVELVGGGSGRMRVEGTGCRISSASGSLSYSVALRAWPAVADVAAAVRPARTVVPPVGWTDSERGGRPVVVGRGHHGRSLVTVEKSAGLVEWSHDGTTLVESPFPTGRKIGPLAHVRTALWVAVQGDRADRDQGVEWVGPDQNLPFSTTLQPGSWTVLLDEEDALDICVGSVDRCTACEVATYLVLGPDVDEIEIETFDGSWLAVACRNVPWRSWTRSFRVRRGAGGYLRGVPVCGDDPGVFVRSIDGQTVVTMLVRHQAGSGARWRLVHERPEEAL
ncbi:MAG: hypothetical protein FWH11_01135 [Micrococcales bacterium]|nr:hypothetical protein [Micrococcales bacterium]